MVGRLRLEARDGRRERAGPVGPGVEGRVAAAEPIEARHSRLMVRAAAGLATMTTSRRASSGVSRRSMGSHRCERGLWRRATRRALASGPGVLGCRAIGTAGTQPSQSTKVRAHRQKYLFRGARPLPGVTARSGASPRGQRRSRIGPRLLGIVDHERERRPVAPAAQEQVAVDVDAGVGELAREPGHAARPVVDLGEDRLALEVRPAAGLEHLARRVVVRRGHDHVTERRRCLRRRSPAGRRRARPSARRASRAGRAGW